MTQLPRCAKEVRSSELKLCAQMPAICRRLVLPVSMCVLLLAWSCDAALPGVVDDTVSGPQWEVVSSDAAPVIGPAETTPHGVYQGFETGQFFRRNGTYYVAINELGLCQHVTWDRTTRAALWSAPNASGPWTRVITLRNTSSMTTLCNISGFGHLPNGCSWAPTLVFAPSISNGSKPVWNLFYSSCEDVGGAPSPDPKLPKDRPGDGIVHAVSTTDSMLGPYVDLPSKLVPGSGVELPFTRASPHRTPPRCSLAKYNADTSCAACLLCLQTPSPCGSWPTAATTASETMCRARATSASGSNEPQSTAGGRSAAQEWVSGPRTVLDGRTTTILFHFRVAQRIR